MQSIASGKDPGAQAFCLHFTKSRTHTIIDYNREGGRYLLFVNFKAAADLYFMNHQVTV